MLPSAPASTEVPAPPVETAPAFVFSPHAVEATSPEKYIKSTDIMVNGEIVSEYVPKEKISFGLGSAYTNVPGLTTFRGNNYRDGGAYGTTELINKKFGPSWTVTTSSLGAPDGSYWSGSGWTGQPLIIEWPRETRMHMTNMQDWAKNAERLVEVIYPTMDGKIYFMELSTGKPTREPLNVGYTFKGTGTVDPRGYPILYIGSGYHSAKGKSKVFIINLLDGSIMHTFGDKDSFAIRDWSMFDSAPLIDAKTDNLIYPGENGVVYIMKLNSKYDKAAGTVSIAPEEPVKWRYNGVRTSLASYWLGFEASPVIHEGYLFLPDNGGNLICLDLNTLKIVWVADILDDSNCTPVLELENGHPYLYISTSFHANWRAYVNATCPVPLWKIDAVTGEKVWEKTYSCRTEKGASGGVQGSVASGAKNISDLVFFPVARTPEGSTGTLVAIDKKSGDVVWEKKTPMYSWSSPVLVYDANGDGYIIYPTFLGKVFLLNARSGETLDTFDIKGHTEATPAVFENFLVIGHRNERIYGIQLT
ncbi:MAG: PQQ-binding-like beta-propeller repeat protein [Ruminococcaceae bacterium]|nr:PQQ-binding-like beta-propeller repeat protein [Oscillospiraceae bacterium]